MDDRILRWARVIAGFLLMVCGVLLLADVRFEEDAPQAFFFAMIALGLGCLFPIGKSFSEGDEETQMRHLIVGFRMAVSFLLMMVGAGLVWVSRADAESGGFGAGLAFVLIGLLVGAFVKYRGKVS